MYRLILCLLAVLGCAPAMAQTFPSPTFLNLKVNGATTLNNGSIAGTFTGGTLLGTTFSGGTISGSTFAGGTLGGSITGTGATITGGTFSGATWSGGTFSGTIAGSHTLSGTLTLTSTLNAQGSINSGTNTTAATNAINGPAASNRFLNWQTAGSRRWSIYADSTAESGSNAGSKLNIQASVDAGTLGTTAIQIDRQFGALIFNTGTITLAGSDPGTAGSTMALRYNQFYTGTTTGDPLTFNQIWVRRDDVNDSSQGQVLDVLDFAACSGSGTCAADSSFTASITGAVMTVSVSASGAIKVGDMVVGSGVAPTHVASFGTGAGGTGTYNMDLSQTVGSEAMTTVTPIASFGRTAIVSNVSATGPISPSHNGTYNGFRASGSGSSDGGGTQLLPGANIQGMNVIAQSQAGATNWDSLDLVQGNIYVQTGANFRTRYGDGYNTSGDNGTQGGILDAFYFVATSPMTDPTQAGPYYGLGMRTAFALGNNGASIPPLDRSNGEIMTAYPYTGAQITPRPPMITWRGFDLGMMQFTDCILCFGAMQVAGTGDIKTNWLDITTATSGPSIDAPLSKASVASIASNGAVAVSVGDQYPSRLGGYVVIDTVDGSSHVTGAHYGTGGTPYRASGEVVQVATGIVHYPAANGASNVILRNGTTGIAAGDSVVALGPSAACNGAIPGGETVDHVNAGAGNSFNMGAVAPTIALASPITAAISYGCMLSFQRTMLSATDTIMVGGAGANFIVNVTWTAATQLQIGATVNTLIGSGSALATNATSGFLLIPSMAGTPTGNVGALGKVALVWDSTNKKLCTIAGATVECSAAFTP